MTIIAAELNSRIKKEQSRIDSDLFNLVVIKNYNLFFYDVATESNASKHLSVGDQLSLVGFYDDEDSVMAIFSSLCDSGVTTLSVTLDVATSLFGLRFCTLVDRLSSEEMSKDDVKALAEDAPWL